MLDLGARQEHLLRGDVWRLVCVLGSRRLCFRRGEFLDAHVFADAHHPERGPLSPASTRPHWCPSPCRRPTQPPLHPPSLVPIPLQEAQAFLQGMLLGETGHVGEEDEGPRDEVAE